MSGEAELQQRVKRGRLAPLRQETDLEIVGVIASEVDERQSP